MQSLLLECAVRAALIAAGTAAVLAALRVKSASARHAAWLGVVVWMLLLPAWSAWVPKAPLRVLPAPRLAVIPTLPISALSLPETPAWQPPEPPKQRPEWNWWIALLAVYIAGIGVLLVRLAIGAHRAQALIRTALRSDGYWTSSSCVAPVTVGWLYPMVILPDAWREWPEAQLAAVLAHENEHARRRDPLMQFLALLNRAFFWFHPLAWWLERRLSALAEEACDAAALSSGHDPYDYSQYLLDIARAVERTGIRVNVLGMAMPGSALPHRIRQILSARPLPHLSRPRAICAGAACVLLSSVFAASALDRQKAPVRLVQPVMAAVREALDVTPTPPAPAPRPPQAQSTQTGRFLVLYFHLPVLDNDDQLRAVAAAQKFVNTQMQPADRLAVMTYDSSVKVLQDFSSDHTLLLQTLSQIPDDRAVQQSPDRLLEGLQMAVNMLSPLKEKKQLVYFTRSAPHTTEELKPLIESAQKANVAFYPVDLAGLPKPGTPQDPPPQAPAPEFEVASVKPAPPAGGRGPGSAGGGMSGVSIPDPNRVSARSVSLRRLIQFAYDVRDFQVTGPGWLDTNRYNIEARSASPATPEQLHQMLQTLLANRFNLALHHDTKVFPIYEMTAATGGTKMPEVGPIALPPDKDPRQHFLFMLATSTTFADVLSHFLGMEMPVVDKTGLTGKYRFVVDIDPGEDVIAAVHDQLGLKLTAKKSPTDILVVDHAEQVPIEN